MKVVFKNKAKASAFVMACRRKLVLVYSISEYVKEVRLHEYNPIHIEKVRRIASNCAEKYNGLIVE